MINKMGFVKSYTNYSIQKKHQLLNNGEIFENNYATIGGISIIPQAGQKVYRHGTFVYSINGENVSPKLYVSQNWEKNGDSIYWSQETMEEINDQNSYDIVLKKDYYKLKDFAYFGSCSELVRTSINDIIQRFPGEMYIPNTLREALGEDDETIGVSGYKYIVENPFNIDIHTNSQFIDIKENNIKFLQINLDNYNIVKNEEFFTIIDIQKREFNTTCPYKRFASVRINGEKNISLTFDCYYNEKGQVFYLTNSASAGYSIRPKQKYYDEFMSSLDTFQKLLLNKDSQPQYSVIFEIVEESEDGYVNTFEKFILPVNENNYNIDITSVDFVKYVDKLSTHAEFYDTIFCNNLYREMTHESIKNFDWTDTLKRDNETKEDYLHNGERIQKMLYICGRELDEIKFYIDNIKNSFNITYSDINNLPDYFLTDVLNIDGWDIRNVFPLDEFLNENIDLVVKPYGNYKYSKLQNSIKYLNGYFSGYFSDNCKISRIEKSNENFIIDNKGYLRNKIQTYINNKHYSMQEMNNCFMKMLKLNSRAILQKKGTIESIEMLLSLFGLKSKRWFESIKNNQKRFKSNNRLTYDYEIIEYVAIAEPLEDKEYLDGENLPKAKFLCDFFNSTKMISYNTNDFRNGIYTPYQGLPIRYYEVDGKRLLYPYFSKDKEIDGNPYFQMNGGWAFQNFDYEYSGETITKINFSGETSYLDTITQISVVNSIQELISMPTEQLYDGIVIYVKNLQGHFIFVDGEMFKIFYDTFESGSTVNNGYFQIQVWNNQIKIGNNIWNGEIETYNSNGTLTVYDLEQFKDGTFLKIYINAHNQITLKQNENFIIDYTIFKNGKMQNAVGNNYTNYFKLYDVNWKNSLSFYGWNQLTTNSKEYKTILNLKRDFKGNNPHRNALKYDDGIEYIKYFSNIFKYAYENELFNQNCFLSLSEYASSLSLIRDLGFENLIIDNGCKEEIKKYQDKKIQYFCNYFDNTEINYFTEVASLNDYSGFTEYSISDKKEYESLSGMNYTCTDQIINLKNVDIIFYIKDDKCVEEAKYIENVILHYLLQIIPSNVILRIKLDTSQSWIPVI